MRLSDSPEEAAWRNEVRDFIAQNLPDGVRGQGGFEEGGGGEGRPDTSVRAGGAGFRKAAGPLGDWRDRLVKRGWIAPAWPEEYGGAGLDILQQFILNQEFAEAGAPQMGGMGVSWIGPTLIVHGTEEQKAEHLPKILSGETQWATGLSEPGAGSDLASIQTRAVKDGDDFVINGQKIWTSGAHLANWMYVLTRTDPDAPKHRGISYILLDMTSPGVSVQPLVQMSGATGFNQVFFDNVRVPARNVVGEVNRGWYVAATSLDFERSSIGSAVGTRKGVERIIEFARQTKDQSFNNLVRNPLVRLELTDRLTEAQVMTMLAYRVVHLQNTGMIPNYEASLAKLFSSELSQRIARTTMRLIGLHGLSWDPRSPYSPNKAQYVRSYVTSVAATIGGGTSEIQRNIISQRGLGMPRD
jgi:alkylation response protein AidB-like acyl-CoA dehydrogenase